MFNSTVIKLTEKSYRKWQFCSVLYAKPYSLVKYSFMFLQVNWLRNFSPWPWITKDYSPKLLLRLKVL